MFKFYIIFLTLNFSAFSQAIFEPIYLVQDSSSFRTSSNKFQNIYNFNDELVFSKNSSLGNVYVIQNYQGQGTPISSNSSFQETQKLRVNYEYEIDRNLFVINKDNWFISSNTLNFGQNKLERLNFLLGSKYIFLDDSFAEFGYGKERNTTVGIESSGDYYYFNYNITELQTGNLRFDSKGFADILALEDGRRNQDMSFNILAINEFDENSTLDFNLGYYNRNRDNPELNPGLNSIPIRRRESNKLLAYTSMNFKISESIYNTLSFSFNNELIENNYINNFDIINESKFKRNVDISEIDISNITTIIKKDFKLNTLLNYRKTNEDYTALNILNLPSNQFEIYKTDQNRQDRIETFFNLKLDNFNSLSSVDSISIGLDYRLLRFDTPSLKNNDDRDELSIAGNIEYLHRISNILSIGIRNEFRLFHYVYLKAQRSASNNWNRVIRLSPTIILHSNYVYYKPQFGINANYTTYDFENLVTGINSFSFREVSYIDSIQIKLSSTYSIESKNELRYSERGILYWDEFAEQPQRSNFEGFFRTLIFYRKEGTKFGSGIRYFKRKDIRISEFISQNSVILNNFESIAPELIFEYQFDSRNTIKLDIWYEFQSINLIRKHELVNFYLSTLIRL